MDWQLPLVLTCLALAVVYLARRTWRTWAGRGSGCGTCKCGDKATANDPSGTKFIPIEQVTLRSRGTR
jgi:hypothetical protein